MTKDDRKKEVKRLILERKAMEEKAKELSSSYTFSEELEQYSGEILKYYSNHGFSIPVRYVTEDNLPLGKFFYSKLRPRYRKWATIRDKKLPKATGTGNPGMSLQEALMGFDSYTISFFKKLSELGFTGKDATSSDWDNGYIKLREYFHMNGHSYVPPGTLFGKDEFPLGTWVTYQRSLLRKGKLSSVKFIKLNRLHFLWNVDLGQLLLSSNSDDPLVRQTKLNLKNTLINLVEKNESPNTARKEQDEFVRAYQSLEKSLKKLDEKTFSLKELEKLDEQLNLKHSSLRDVTEARRALEQKIAQESEEKTELRKSIKQLERSMSAQKRSYDAFFSEIAKYKQTEEK